MTTRKALVVDDSATARHVLGRMLKKLDFTIIQAASGEDAVDKLRSNSPDIIFLDHMMPGMDGFQVLKAIKSDDNISDIPVVMYTSQAAAKYKEEAIALGAVGVISKQLDENTLYTTVEKILSKAPKVKVEVYDLASNDYHAGYSTETSKSRPTAPEPVEQKETLEKPHTPTQETYSPTFESATPPPNKSLIRRYPGRAAIIAVLIFLPLKMLFNLSEQVQAQKETIINLSIRLQVSQLETTQKYDELLQRVTNERQSLEEEKILVSELILSLAERIAANTASQIQQIEDASPTQEGSLPQEDPEQEESTQDEETVVSESL